MEENRMAKIASAKAMKKADFTYEQIAEKLDISDRTAFNYVKEISSPEWNEFCDILSKLLTISEGKLATKTLELIEQKMDRAKFGELVNLYRTIRTENKPQTQVNIANGGEMKIEFIDE